MIEEPTIIRMNIQRYETLLDSPDVGDRREAIESLLVEAKLRLRLARLSADEETARGPTADA